LCVFADADCEDSSCESTESESWSVFWDDDEEDEEEEEEQLHEEPDVQLVQEDEDDGSDVSHDSCMHRTCSAETVTFELDEYVLWHSDITSDMAEWPTASADSDDSGADELL